jgi:pimeloyl-ACP methyl ester carboxylesterase
MSRASGWRLLCAGGLAACVGAAPSLAQDTQWTSTDTTISTPTGMLAGTITRPASSARYPLVLLIAGSGPTDRNGNVAGAGSGPATLRLLAEALAVRGIAVLRYDKRGIAGSRAAGRSESDMRFDLLADDAAAWARAIRTDRRVTTVTIAGHSEGSLLGMLATQRAPVDAFISIAGPGRRADQVLHDQLASALPAALQAQSDSVLARLVAGDTVSRSPPGLEALFRPSVQPYLISWFRYTPSLEISNLRVPIMIAQGTHDFQVLPTEAALLAAAVPRAMTVTVEGMNHVLKLSPADRAQQLAGAYVDPTLPVALPLVDSIAAFVRRAPPTRR